MSPVVESLRLTVFSDGRLVIASPTFDAGLTIQCLAIAIRKCALSRAGNGIWQLAVGGGEVDPESNIIPFRRRQQHPSTGS